MAIDLCLVSGVLYGMNGSPSKGVVIRIRNVDNPVAVGSEGVITGEVLRVISDASGAVAFNLIQGGQYRIELPGRSLDYVRTVTVPEEDTVDLTDLLYPYVVSAEWDDEGPLEEDAGFDFTVVVNGTFSDGSEDDVASACTFEVSDTSILRDKGSGTFRAKAAGTATITITALSQSDALAEPDGDPVYRTDVPEAALPAALTVIVS